MRSSNHAQRILHVVLYFNNIIFTSSSLLKKKCYRVTCSVAISYVTGGGVIIVFKLVLATFKKVCYTLVQSIINPVTSLEVLINIFTRFAFQVEVNVDTTTELPVLSF